MELDGARVFPHIKKLVFGNFSLLLCGYLVCTFSGRPYHFPDSLSMKSGANVPVLSPFDRLPFNSPSFL